jgi:YIF1
MSYYNQGGGGGGGGGYYGAGGGGGDPQQQQQQHHQQQQQQQQQQHLPDYGYGGYGQQQPAYGAAPQQGGGDPNSYHPQQQQQQQQYNESLHANIWQNQQPQPPYQQQQPQQQPQQPYGSYSTNSTPNIFAAPGAAPFFNPNMAVQMAALAATGLASGGDSQNAILNMANAAGQTFWQNSTARMVPGLASTLQILRPYFAVDNRYVLQKMKRLAVPFVYKTWKRTVRDIIVCCCCVVVVMWTVYLMSSV